MNPSDLRAETLNRFSTWGLNANVNLPLLESVADLQPKSASDVAARVVAAGYVAALCFGAPAEKIRSSLDRFALWTHLSSDEQDFVSIATLSAQSTGFHSWLIESVQFMTWALGIVALDHFAHVTTHWQVKSQRLEAIQAFSSATQNCARCMNYVRKLTRCTCFTDLPSTPT